MKIHEKYIKRCIEIAENGLGTTAPNPMVGSVIVHNNQIIGEGFTSPYGGAHAEVNAINAVKNKSHLKAATLYVTLEPCSHFGKTPPCSDLIITHEIPNVVIGCTDDREVNLIDHILPYYYAIRKKGGNVKFHVYQTGHRFGRHYDQLSDDIGEWMLK